MNAHIKNIQWLLNSIIVYKGVDHSRSNSITSSITNSINNSISDSITSGCQVKLFSSQNVGSVDVSTSHAPCNWYVC